VGIGKHFNLSKASKVIKAGQKDVARKPAKVVRLDDHRKPKGGGKK